MTDVRIHPTAMVEEGVELGQGSVVWDHVHIRGGARIGEECSIGGKSYIAPGVRIGNRVKIGSLVLIPDGITIEDGVMVSMGTMFTNERAPRATTPDLARRWPSEPTERTLATLVRAGATLGARVTVGAGLVIGRFALVGMAGVVTRSVPDFHLAVGHPARSVAAVCRCGQILRRFAEADSKAAAGPPQSVACGACGREYGIAGLEVSEIGPLA